MRGLADASGIDYQMILRLNMFAELTKASCSFFGAWGEATLGTGKSYQLRALDYDIVGPFKDYPQITVYHPNEGDGYAFANVGWPGSIGVLTGELCTTCRRGCSINSSNVNFRVFPAADWHK
jgi:isopenicillin-N N-acyltransferase-like protein